MRSLLISCLFLAPILAAPAPYIITSYVELSVYTHLEAETLLGTTYTEEVETITREVIPDATPVTDAVKTLTDTSAYAHITLVEVVLPPGSGSRPTSSYDYYATTTAVQTSYVVPITYTPKPSCTGTAQNWTYVTNVPIYIPTIIASLITPSALTTSISRYTYYDDRVNAATYVNAILNPTDVAADSLASASSNYEPYSMSYCYTPQQHASLSSRPQPVLPHGDTPATSPPQTVAAALHPTIYTPATSIIAETARFCC
ncbi:hypothetical protein H4I96_09238 [Botrytis cinerea]